MCFWIKVNAKSQIDLKLFLMVQQMSQTENDSYMHEVANSNTTSINDEDEDIVSDVINDVTKVPSAICGETACYNDGRCDPVSQKCKCRAPHAGSSEKLFSFFDKKN